MENDWWGMMQKTIWERWQHLNQTAFLTTLILGFLLIAYFFVGAYLGVSTSYFDAALDGRTVYMIEGQENIVIPLYTGLILFLFWLPPFFGGWTGLILAHAVIPVRHVAAYYLTVGSSMVAMALACLSGGLIMFAEFYAADAAEHQLAVKLAAVIYYFLSLIIQVACLGLAVGAAQARSLPRWLINLTLGLILICFLFDLAVTPNPDAPTFRLIFTFLLLISNLALIGLYLGLHPVAE